MKTYEVKINRHLSHYLTETMLLFNLRLIKWKEIIWKKADDEKKEADDDEQTDECSVAAIYSQYFF